MTSDAASDQTSRDALGAQHVALLAFELGQARFGLVASCVREVVRAVTITSLPNAPGIVEGAINFRGAVVPVLDIRGRFRLPAVPLRADQVFIISQAGQRTVALRVDRATELISVRPDAIHPAQATAGAGLIAGIAALPDGLLVIHDLDRFLSLDEGEQLDAALDVSRDAALSPMSSGTAP